MIGSATIPWFTFCDPSRGDRRILSTWPSKMAWFTGFPVNVVNFISANLGEMQEKDQGTRPWYFSCLYSDLCRFRACPQERQLSILEQGEVYWSRPWLVHKLGQEIYHMRFHPNNIVESKFPKWGYPRWKNTTKGEWYNSRPLREQLHARKMEDRNAPLTLTAHLPDINGTVQSVNLIACWRLAVSRLKACFFYLIKKQSTSQVTS